MMMKRGLSWFRRRWIKYASILAGLIVMIWGSNTSFHADKPADVEEIYFENISSPPPPLAETHQYNHQCGNWQMDYAKLHASILEGRSEPRYVVGVAVEAGLADNLSGFVSIFYYALLTGRAFQWLSYGELPDMEAAFDYGAINWTTSHNHSVETWKHLKYTQSGPREMPSHFKPRYQSIYHINWPGVTNYYSTADFNEFGDGDIDPEFVMFASNRGRSYVLFENPHYTDRLFQMGLRPETAFACAMQFLFRPKPEVAERTREMQTSMLAHKDSLKIGIHIRTGDSSFTTQSTFFTGNSTDYPSGPSNATIRYLEPFNTYFDCARQIGESRSVDRDVVWLFLSDSLDLRRVAKLHYGDKVITDTASVAVHLDCALHNPEMCGKLSVNEGLKLAVSQMLLFSEMDYHVVSLNSGFGQTAAWMSLKWHHIFAINEAARDPRKCGLFDYDSYEFLAGWWSGK